MSLRSRFVFLNSFQLKCIAMLTMLIDHIGAICFPQIIWLRSIGRLSFPIFCFLIVEGFFYTRDIRCYMARLGLFALLSEIPYDLAFYHTIWNPQKQNVFFSLFIGICILWVIGRKDEWGYRIIEVLLAMWFAEIMHVDYGFRGILLIVWFYIMREKRWLKYAGAAAWNFIRGQTIQGYGALSVFPIALYNGKRGPNIKYFFYMFYPVHLLVLYLIHSRIL